MKNTKMNRGIYFIGGASASGKSAIATILTNEFGDKHIELDGIYDVISHAVDNEKAAMQITTDVVILCMKKWIEYGVDGIVEGGWIDPSQAAKLVARYKKKFHPVYCGYPRADIADRLAMITATGDHWLAEINRQAARDWLAKQVAGSRWYESECAKFKIPFFDLSDLPAGSHQLQDHYRAWRKERN